MAHYQFSGFVVLCAVSCAVVGCKDEPKKLSEVVAECADLPGMRTSKNSELREELKRITEEGGTPLQLVDNLPTDEQNVAAAMVNVFDSMLVESLLNSSKECYPKDKFEFNPADFARAIAFKRSHTKQLHKIYAALKRPHCNFGVEFDQGYFYEEKFIDEVVIAARLLAFDVADRLRKRGPTKATVPLKDLFRLVECLSECKDITARIEAEQLRAQALRVMEAVANHKDTTRENTSMLYHILRKQLNNWPSDADSLIGERALVMHSYEGIRAELLPWILTKEEKAAFKSEHLMKDLEKTLMENADLDELQYLQAMRTIIESCERPYYQRSGTIFDAIEKLRSKRSSNDFAFAAVKLFLPGIDTSLQQIADDRMRCEAMAIALAGAANEKTPPYEINPRTGDPYRIEKTQSYVKVELNDDVWSPKIQIPKKSAPKKAPVAK